MEYPAPKITFVDRAGKALAVHASLPFDGEGCLHAVDRGGAALAIQTTPPDHTQTATALARGVAVETERWIPGFYVHPELGEPFDAWADDWECNGYTENFDSPPLADPPWHVIFDYYLGGEVHAKAYLKVSPMWPMSLGIDFYWHNNIEAMGPGPYGQIRLLTGRVGVDQISYDNYAILEINASDPAWIAPGHWFEFRLGSHHIDFGDHADSWQNYANSDPWLVDGERFTATIYRAGRVEAAFYGHSWNNGGPT